MSQTTPLSQGLTPRQIDLAGVAVCLAAALLVFIYGVGPQLAMQAQVERGRADLADRRVEASQAVAALTAAKRELAQAEQALARSPLQLQPAGAINRHLARITEMATDAGIKLNEVQPGEAVRGTHYDVVPITLEGTGHFPSAVLLIRQLHEVFPDTGVAAFVLTGDPARPQAPATFRLSLAWYAAPIDRRPAN